MTTTTATDYVLGHSDPELERLARQAAFWAETTDEAFRRAGISEGMRVLDVGSGIGDVAFAAARIVGPTGYVLGIDPATDALDRARRSADAARIGRVAFEAHDLHEYVAAEPFDAIVGRLILMHLSDPASALRALARSLRPGGIACFQELDCRAARSFPNAPLFEECIRSIVETFERAGFDPDSGCRLRSIFATAGLPAPQALAVSHAGGGPDFSGYAYAADTVRALLPAMEKLGVVPPRPVDTLAERLREQAVALDACVFSPPFVTVWVTMPA